MKKRIWTGILCLGVLLTGCISSTSGTDGLQMQADLETVPMTEAATESALASGNTSSIVSSDRYAYTGSKEGLRTDSFTYFTFSNTEISHTDETDQPLLQEALDKTTFYSQCDIQTKWINEVLADLQRSDEEYGAELLEYAKQDKRALGDGFYCHSHYVSRGVARHDDHVISMISQTSVYSGGAHPYLSQTSLNLDMKNLKSLTLEDVVIPAGCTRLYEMIVSQVESKFSSLGEGALLDHYREIIADALTYGKMTPYWYFNQKGLVVYFNQYELAPYAAGIIKIELGYEMLDGVLSEIYFPEEISGWVTNATVKKELSEKRTTYEVKLGEGEVFYISLSGTATRVQLSEVRFAEQTAVASTMFFSANRLDDDVTLAVCADPDPEKIYAVEYYDESGGPKILYFRNNQILLDLNQ